MHKTESSKQRVKVRRWCRYPNDVYIFTGNRKMYTWPLLWNNMCDRWDETTKLQKTTQQTHLPPIRHELFSKVSIIHRHSDLDWSLVPSRKPQSTRVHPCPPSQGSLPCFFEHFLNAPSYWSIRLMQTPTHSIFLILIIIIIPSHIAFQLLPSDLLWIWKRNRFSLVRLSYFNWRHFPGIKYSFGFWMIGFSLSLDI